MKKYKVVAHVTKEFIAYVEAENKVQAQNIARENSNMFVANNQHNADYEIEGCTEIK